MGTFFSGTHRQILQAIHPFPFPVSPPPEWLKKCRSLPWPDVLSLPPCSCLCLQRNAPGPRERSQPKMEASGGLSRTPRCGGVHATVYFFEYCNVAILLVVTKDLPISPRFSPTNFYRDASSALLQLLNQWLNFIYPRSHVFRYYYGSQNVSALSLRD